MVLTGAASVTSRLLGQLLLLEDKEGERLLLVSLDLIDLDTEVAARLRWSLCAATGVLPERIILNASHTHSGPMTIFTLLATSQHRPAALEIWLKEGLEVPLMEVASRLEERLQPIEARVSYGASLIGINRRQRQPDGSVQLAPNPEGEIAPDLLVLDLVAPASGERAIAFSHGCHPVLDHGWDPQTLSADFPGVARDAIRASLGPESLHVQFFQAVCGDVRPRIVAQGERFRPSTRDDTLSAGRELAHDLLQSMAQAQPLSLDLRAAEATFLVPKNREAFPVDPAYWEEEAHNSVGAVQAAAQYWHAKALEGGTLQSHALYPMSAGLFTLGSGVVIAWMSGEPLVGWQRFLRERLRVASLILWGNTFHGGGVYLPLDHQLAEGGYEVESALYFAHGPQPPAPSLNQSVGEVFDQLAAQVL